MISLFLVVLGVIASTVLGLEPCSDQLVSHFYSDCVNGKRTAIYYYTEDCDKQEHQLPSNKPGLNCDVTCNPGENLPFGTTNCQKCQLGQYSIGPGEIFATWNSIPETMSTNCVGFNCSPWIPKENFISSGENPSNDIASHLKYKAKFLQSTGNKIKFSYRVDAESCKGSFCDGLSFYIDDIKQLEVSHVLKWTTVEFDVTPGSHSFQWTFSKDVSLDQGEDLASIRLIETLGTVLNAEYCANCAAGYFSSSAGASVCQECDYNTYSSYGSSSCQPCQEGQGSFRGSSECTTLKTCSQNDYYLLAGDCNPATLTKTVTHAYWLGNKNSLICYPPGGIPPDDITVPCTCPPGKQLNKATGNCDYCPQGFYKSTTGDESCAISPAANYAAKSLYFSEWNKLSSRFTTSCEGDCETNGWIPMGNKVIPSRNRGEINSILSFDFLIASDVSWIEIKYSHNCTSRYTCNLRLFVDKDTDDADSYNLPSNRNVYRVSLKQGEYNVMLQYTHFSSSKSASVDVFSIQVYGTSEGGALSYNPCLAGSEAPSAGSTSCILCNPGFYNSFNESNCVSVPEGSFTEKPGMSYFETCGPNTQSNTTHCLSDCTFTPQSIGFGTITYDLKPLNDPVNMHFAGAETTGLSYYLNLCQKQTGEGVCYGKDGIPLNTFGCQRIVQQDEAVDIGHIIGFLPLEPADIDAKTNDSVLDRGLKITLAGGKYGCRGVDGVGVNRETNITMICDDKAGIGTPTPLRGFIAETSYRSCKYQFVWRSLYACPLCTIEDYSIVVSDCINGKQTTSQIRIKECWDPNPPADQFSNCRACPLEGNEICSGRGTCDFTQGVCQCETQWAGSNCEQCKTGYYGANCTLTCQGSAENPCSGHGSCSGGISGDGKCTCSTGWTGDSCNACDIGFEGPDCTALPATIAEVFPWWSFIIPVVVLVAAAILGFTLWKQKRQIENRYRSLENNNPIQLDDDIPVSFPESR